LKNDTKEAEGRRFEGFDGAGMSLYYTVLGAMCIIGLAANAIREPVGTLTGMFLTFFLILAIYAR